jgi:hypothetical protein
MPYSLTPELALRRLGLLDRGRQIAFGIFMFERALPDLIQFQTDSGWLGEGGRVRAALAQAWAALDSEHGNFLQFITEDVCEGALPDSEEHSSVYISAAIDAVDLACNILAFVGSGDLEPLAAGVICRQDTVAMFVQITEDMNPNDPNLNERIQSHPLMRDEVGFLLGDLVALADAPRSRSELVPWVRKRISANEYGKPRLLP